MLTFIISTRIPTHYLSAAAAASIFAIEPSPPIGAAANLILASRCVLQTIDPNPMKRSKQTQLHEVLACIPEPPKNAVIRRPPDALVASLLKELYGEEFDMDCCETDYDSTLNFANLVREFKLNMYVLGEVVQYKRVLADAIELYEDDSHDVMARMIHDAPSVAYCTIDNVPKKKIWDIPDFGIPLTSALFRSIGALEPDQHLPVELFEDILDRSKDVVPKQYFEIIADSIETIITKRIPMGFHKECLHFDTRVVAGIFGAAEWNLARYNALIQAITVDEEFHHQDGAICVDRDFFEYVWKNSSYNPKYMQQIHSF